MLANEEFTAKYIKTNRERLRKRHSQIVEGLKDAGIECLRGNAGLFCWINLTEMLEEKSMEAELRLWKMILKEMKLNVSPGSSCHCVEPGWFRVCFANMTEETLDVALRRMKVFVEKMKLGKKAKVMNSR